MGELIRAKFGNEKAIAAFGDSLMNAGSGLSDYDGKPILKLGRDDGEWSFGEDDTFIEEGDLLAVNVLTAKEGYIAFNERDNSVAETEDEERAEVMSPIGRCVPYDELPELAEVKGKRTRQPEWHYTLSIEMRVVEGPNAGAEVVYKPTSQGGIKALSKLLHEIGRRIKSGDEECVPIIELWSNSYHSRRWKKDIFNPIMEIRDWTDLDATEFDSSDVEDDEDEKPKTKKAAKKGRGKAAPEKPAKRRGRRDEDEYDDEEDEVIDGETVDEDEADEDEEEPPRGRRRGAKTPAKPAKGGRRRRSDPEDEEDEEEPAKPASRRRRTREDDDEDEAPKAGKRRSRRDAETDDDENEKPSKPASRRRRRDDDDEDEPAPKARSSRRRTRDDDDEDEAEEAPASRRTGVRGKRAASGGRRRAA